MNWLSVASALAALAAALFAYRAARGVRGAAVIAPAPDARRGAPLRLTVLDADVRLGLADDTSVFALLLSIANDSGVPRAFSDVELRVKYRTAANFSGAVDVPLDSSPDPGGVRTGEVTLRTPLELGARQSLIGWAHFTAAGIVPRESRVDGYAIVLKGSAGEYLLAEASLATVRHSASRRAIPG